MSHEIGNKLENICREYVLEHFSLANPKIIETKLNSIHGIDFAVSLNDNEIVFIVEVKSKHGSVRMPQMSDKWIKDRITSELKNAIKDTIKKGGVIKALSYKVDNTDEQNPIIKYISPTRELNSNELFNNDNNNKNNENMSTRQFQYQIELLYALKKYLDGFKESLEISFMGYDRQVNELRDTGQMDDQMHQSFVDNCLHPTQSKIKELINQIENEDIPFVKERINDIQAIVDRF